VAILHRLFWVVLAAQLLAGCAGLPVASAPSGPASGVAGAVPYPGQWREDYAAAPVGGERVLAFDGAGSVVRIYVHRGGRAPQLGHNHVLSAPQLTGLARVDPGALARARFDLEFRLDALQIDDPALRAVLGPAFEGELDARAIAGTRAHMLGEDNFQADRYPLVHVRSLGLSGEPPWMAAQVEVWLHGVVRTQWVPLEIASTTPALDVRGSMVLRQSDFGVHPYEALGGLIAVQDAVVVEFHLRARPL